MLGGMVSPHLVQAKARVCHFLSCTAPPASLLLKPESFEGLHYCLLLPSAGKHALHWPISEGAVMSKA